MAHAFLATERRPFSDVLAEEKIAAAFKNHGGLFGRGQTYTTSTVLCAFLQQVLFDSKQAAPVKFRRARRPWLRS